ncbi:MAG: hypothetical protein ACT4P2_16370 [Pseudomonadota bacterium]
MDHNDDQVFAGWIVTATLVGALALSALLPETAEFDGLRPVDVGTPRVELTLHESRLPRAELDLPLGEPLDMPAPVAPDIAPADQTSSVPVREPQSCQTVPTPPVAIC